MNCKDPVYQSYENNLTLQYSTHVVPFDDCKGLQIWIGGASHCFGKYSSKKQAVCSELATEPGMESMKRPAPDTCYGLWAE